MNASEANVRSRSFAVMYPSLQTGSRVQLFYSNLWMGYLAASRASTENHVAQNCEGGAFHDTNGRMRVRSFQGQGGGEPIMVSVCSCTQCQMRTGSVVSFGAYFPKDSVQPVSGTGTFNSFVRPADSGAKLTFYFCPTCDSNIFWEGRYSFWEGRYSRSDFRGVAAGCLADPSFPRPQVAFYTVNQHSWVTFPAGTMPFETEPSETEALALKDKLGGS